MVWGVMLYGFGGVGCPKAKVHSSDVGTLRSFGVEYHGLKTE